MRQILAFIGLALFMVAAYLLYQVGQQSKRDSTIIGWANSLVWEALATPSSPLFQDSKVEPAAQGGGWTVTGRIVNVAADRNSPDGDYVAEVTRICAAGNERRCWKLSRLTIGDRFYVGSGIVALPKPSQQADRIRVKGARDGPPRMAPPWPSRKPPRREHPPPRKRSQGRNLRPSPGRRTAPRRIRRRPVPRRPKESQAEPWEPARRCGTSESRWTTAPAGRRSPWSTKTAGRCLPFRHENPEKE